MNGAFYVGAVGLQSQQRALDVIASNIANVNTPAFKRSEVRFSEVLATRDDADVPRADLADAAMASAGVTVSATPMIDESGQVETTGRPMDLAIDGKGFIELMGSSGQTLLWRGGMLKVGEDGLLGTASGGLPLKAAITVPADANAITIGADGVVRAQTGDATATEIGQIDLVKVDDISGMTRLDGGLYRVGDSSKVLDAKPGEDGLGTLAQGSIERSNVEMTTEMVQLMLVQRAYGANAQIVQAADQLMAIANGLRR